MSVLKNLQPERVFYYFEEITKIPHGSGNTKQISDYLAGFARDHGLRYIQDASNNIIIFKEASQGYEKVPCVILQGHMDMVCEKTPESSHDFAKDPLELQKLPHPALEVLLTVDEEIGLLGAAAVDTSPLKGRYLINLDSEEEGYLWVGCAGGLTAQTRIPVKYQEAGGVKYQVTVSGLTGGHSGSEIDKNRANATLLLGRFLFETREQGEYALAEIEGGQKDNAIPRTARALLVADSGMGSRLQEFAKRFTEDLRKEYTGSDEGITVTVEPQGEGQEPVLHPVSQEKIIFFLLHYPNGIQKMCGYMDGLVETSCNLGIIRLTPEAFLTSASVRSSVATEKKALADKIAYLTEFLGGEYKAEGDYPSWEYKQDSKLRPYMVDIYEKMFQTRPEVKVIHAGLECGLFYEKIPGLDCVSLGPDMKDIHTTEEKLSISSVQKVWEYLLEVLKNIKE